MLGPGEVQRAGQRVEHLARGVDVAGLLQPRVPGDADPGHGRDLLAPQSGDPTSTPGPVGRQTEGGPVDLGPARAQKRGELGALVLLVGHRVILVLPLLASRASSS